MSYIKINEEEEKCEECGRVDYSAYMCWRVGHLHKEEDKKYKMQNIQKEFLYHLNVVQTTLAHLLQDGDVTDSGLDAVNNLLFITEQLQKKYGDG